MKLLKSLIAVAAVTAATASFAATTFNVATYNIRTLTDDKGENHWDERKDYVCQLMHDYNFDIVGLNEVRFGQQEADVRARMPEYTIVGWDGTGAGFQVEGHTNTDLVCVRNDKFTVIDSGWFLLCHDDNVWTLPWDNSSVENVRLVSWAKVSPIEAPEEVFFVFSTHLDHKGDKARAMQAQKTVEKIREIAGSHPVILMGDMNATTTRKNVYNLFRAHFDDAFTKVESLNLPYESTSGKWDGDETDGSRIDYIFLRYFNVNSYVHIPEKYDRVFTPSDHIPVMANVTYAQTPRHTWHVDLAAGSDEADGSQAAPLATVAKAIKMAARADTIMVTEGTMQVESPMKIDRSLVFLGGWNADFTATTGKTTIQATGANRCVDINSEIAVVMSRFRFCDGNLTAADQDGGAIRCKAMTLTLRDCDVINNSCTRNGGGVWASSHIDVERCVFDGNTAGGDGGAYYCNFDNKRYWYNYKVDGCHFRGNKAAEGSAIYLPRFIMCWISNNTFEDNSASAGSTIWLQAHREDNTLGCDLNVFCNTFVANNATQAAALWVDIEDNAAASIVANTIVGNTGGCQAVYLQSCLPYVWHNIIASNNGGDFFAKSEEMSTSYNMFTTSATTSCAVGSKGIAAETPEQALEYLKAVMEGDVMGDCFVPTLSLSDDDVVAGRVTPMPTMISPVIPGSTKSLRCIPANRLTENLLRADFDFDVERWGLLTTDQRGTLRPTDGSATMGAVECPVSYEDGIDAPQQNEDATAISTYFDLLGRPLAAPVTGIYIENNRLALKK